MAAGPAHDRTGPGARRPHALPGRVGRYWTTMVPFIPIVIPPFRSYMCGTQK